MRELGWGGSNRTLARWSRHVASWTNVACVDCRVPAWGARGGGMGGCVRRFLRRVASVGEVGCVRMDFCHFIGVCSFVTDGLFAMVAR